MKPRLPIGASAGNGLRQAEHQFTGPRLERLVHVAPLPRRLVGLGLLEAIPESTILSRARSLAICNGDGIFRSRTQRVPQIQPMPASPPADASGWKARRSQRETSGSLAASAYGYRGKNFPPARPELRRARVAVENRSHAGRMAT